jgi:hypothetical protein
VGSDKFLLVGSDLVGLNQAKEGDFIFAVYPGTEIGEPEDALAYIASDDDMLFEQSDD